MCGISGFIGQMGQCKLSEEDFLRHIRNRGPDGEGCLKGGWFTVAHTRLSIIDLSDQAAQPFMSECQNYIIVFNGEVFNYQEIRHSLETTYGVKFRTTSDTEVLLYSLIYRGLLATLNDVEGFFSFCFIDLIKKRAILARDHIGVKPLYYASLPEGIYFSSSMYTLAKAVKGCSSYNKEAIAGYLVDGFFRSPDTAIQKVHKLRPGMYIEIDMDGSIVSEKEFFSIEEEFFNHGETTDRDIKEVAALRTVSDVPIGLLLSTGVDSSLLSYLYGHSGVDMKAFTVNFGDEEKAIDIVRFNKNEHELLPFDSCVFDDVTVEKLSKVYDEPFSDISSTPTLFIFSQVSKYNKVAIGGDGADEIFLGYKRYLYHQNLMRLNVLLSWVPALVKKLVLNLDWKLFRKYSYRMKRLSFFLTASRNLKLAALNSIFLPNEVFGYKTRYQDDSLASCVLSDLKYYLPDDIFFKVDRASMYAGVEAREPLASRRLLKGGRARIEAFQKNGEAKPLLKQMIKDFNPLHSFGRKKGFSYDISIWAKKHYGKEEVSKVISNLENKGLLEIVDQKVLKQLYVENSDSYLKMYALISLLTWIDRWEEYAKG